MFGSSALAGRGAETRMPTAATKALAVVFNPFPDTIAFILSLNPISISATDATLGRRALNGRTEERLHCLKAGRVMP